MNVYTYTQTLYTLYIISACTMKANYCKIPHALCTVYHYIRSIIMTCIYSACCSPIDYNGNPYNYMHHHGNYTTAACIRMYTHTYFYY